MSTVQAIECLVSGVWEDIANSPDSYSIENYRALMTVTRWLSTQPAAAATEWADRTASLEENQAEWERDCPFAVGGPYVVFG